jgi:glycosyltransferase involved in cell wall biosynthesis
VRVALIGNMNNNFFAVCRYLRDRGVDAHLLLFDHETAHFGPAHDTFDLGYRAFTRQLGWGSNYLTVHASVVADDLAEFDFLIGCGPAPAFAWRAGRVLDLFIPYDSDIALLPFPRLVNPRIQAAYLAQCVAQRRGIRAAPVLAMDMTNDALEAFYKRLHYPGRRLRRGIPMLYTAEYGPDTIARYYDRTHWYHEFAAIRSRHDLVVFHHARHFWTSGPDPLGEYKANDILIRGLARFRETHPDVRACIVTLEYGPDASATRQLAEELGVAGDVYWFPLMSRKDLMVGLSLADMGCGEFGRSCLSCGTVYETLAMAKPLLHHREDALYQADYPELYPMLNVRTAGDVADAFASWAADPAGAAKMGRQGRDWLQRFAIEAPLAEYMALIRGAAERRAGRASVAGVPAPQLLAAE